MSSSILFFAISFSETQTTCQTRQEQIGVRFRTLRAVVADRHSPGELAHAEQLAGEIVERAADEETDWKPPFSFPLKLRNEVRGADVERNPRGNRQSILAKDWKLLC